MKIFVYGTLKRGFGNHRLLETSRLIGEDSIRGLLINFGLPGVIEGEGTVQGEVYEVDADVLARLDRLEGHPHFYERTTTVSKSGQALSYYKYHHAAPGRVQVIQSGRWE